VNKIVHNPVAGSSEVEGTTMITHMEKYRGVLLEVQVRLLEGQLGDMDEGLSAVGKCHMEL
jgi:hypothetical protein